MVSINVLVKRPSQHYTSLLDFSTFDDVAHVPVNQSPFKEIQNSVAELEIKVKDFYRAGSGKNTTGTEESLLSACFKVELNFSLVIGNGPHMDFTSVPIIREEFLQRKLLSK